MTQAKFPMLLDEERAKYVNREVAYEQTIESLREQLATAQDALENEQAKGIHSCHANCTMDGCVNRKLREQLADSQKREVMLRDKVDWLRRYGCKDDLAFRVAQDALAATADLDGLILCHATPVATGLFDYFGECHAIEHNPKAAMGPGQLGKSKEPLYRAWEPTP